MRMFTKTLVMLLLCILYASVEGRGIWGNKRRREEVERNAEAAGGVEIEEEVMARGFEATRRQAQGGDNDAILNNMPSKHMISSAINAYVDMMEKMLESPDFEKMVTPEAVKGVLGQIPGLDAYPEMAAMLQDDKFEDPEAIKIMITEGIEAMRMSADQLAEVLSDPDQISMILDQLPEDAKNMINVVLSGDMSALKGMINQIPGLLPSQKKLITSMLDGPSGASAMEENVKEILSDPDQVEAARQQMLANPGMAEMLGVSKEVLADPVMFAKLINQGMEELGNSGTDADVEDMGRKFGASMAA